MCGRYRRTTQEEELARLYHIPIPKQTDLPISYNIAPRVLESWKSMSMNQVFSSGFFLGEVVC
jgi:hypothetical protein